MLDTEHNHLNNSHTNLKNNSGMTRKLSIRSKNKMKSSRNITLMVMFHSILYIFGNYFSNFYKYISFNFSLYIQRNGSIFDVKHA